MKVGIALGGGGAKGLAHIPLLEVIDELGIRPHAVAGTSIGAVIGALYAGGLSGAELRSVMDTLLHPEQLSDRFVRTGGRRPSLRHILKWLEVVRPSGRRAALLHLDRLFEALAADFNVETFEQLQIHARGSSDDHRRPLAQQPAHGLEHHRRVGLDLLASRAGQQGHQSLVVAQPEQGSGLGGAAVGGGKKAVGAIGAGPGLKR